MDLFFEYLFPWFFGNTGRLVIKAISLGQTDLDLDRWYPCFLAIIVGLLFWIAMLLGFTWLKYPQIFSYFIQLALGN